MALRRNVLQEDNILCELYVDTRSDVFGECKHLKKREVSVPEEW